MTSISAVQGSLLAQHAFTSKTDQLVQYALAHRLLMYVAIGAALLIVIPLGRVLFSWSGHTSMSLNSAPASPIASINEAPATRCTHCSASMSSRQDFCPACGYAQPVRQTGTAYFPG
jgi:hypothetical protein